MLLRILGGHADTILRVYLCKHQKQPRHFLLNFDRGLCGLAFIQDTVRYVGGQTRGHNHIILLCLEKSCLSKQNCWSKKTTTVHTRGAHREYPGSSIDPIRLQLSKAMELTGITLWFLSFPKVQEVNQDDKDHRECPVVWTIFGHLSIRLLFKSDIQVSEYWPLRLKYLSRSFKCPSQTLKVQQCLFGHFGPSTLKADSW